MIFYLKKKKCGTRDLEFCGYMKVIITLAISIVKLLTGSGETRLRLWRILGEKGVWMKMA